MSLDRLFKAHDIVSHKSPLVHMFGNVENSMESVPSRKRTEQGLKVSRVMNWRSHEACEPTGDPSEPTACHRTDLIKQP